MLVTGATGFVGSSLANRLRDLGAEVYGISRSVRSDNLIKGNITSYSFLNQVVKKRKIEVCFHLAGEALVEEGQKAPYSTFKTNILGTLNVLEVARKNNLSRVIISSSSHVYGENKLPYYEIYSPHPTRPYETSKASTDLITLSYANSFNLPVLIPRFVNIYGPGDLHFNRLIPKTVKAVITGKKLEMWGGKSLRDYLFVDDAVEAYLKLAEYDLKNIKSNRIFNIGSDNLISAEDLVKKIVRISGKNVSIKNIPDEREKEINSQYVSWDKAREALGWNPAYSLEKGLKKTYIWYEDFFKKKRSNE